MFRTSIVVLSLLVFVGTSAAPTALAQATEGASADAIPARPPLPEPEPTFLDRLDEGFGRFVVTPLSWVFFFDLIFWDNRLDDLDPPFGLGWIVRGAAGNRDGGLTLPFIVVWLILGALFFTLRLTFINIRGLRHAVEIAAGKFDKPGEVGEVTHFQALSSALSATVGLGNIAGVAIAVSVGGPGAVFWMVVAGFFGMSSKFAECTLGQVYRKVDAQGRVLGGPMRYLSEGLKQLGRPRLGRVLAAIFAAMCIGGSFGGGNMFQSNQAFTQTARVIPFLADKGYLFGLLMAVLVGLVIIGGMKRIGKVAGAIVPLMCAIYILTGISILVMHADRVPAAFSVIAGEAFRPAAGLGGAIGVLITGFQRAAFSNEAGIGSASIAHSAAATDEPVREGMVALLEPLIDTIFVCTMTGLVVVVTGEYLHPPEAGDHTVRGVLMTSAAFESVLPQFKYVLAAAVLLFAFSTMVSWSYYGERCWEYLFGRRSLIAYRVLFLAFVVIGAILKLSSVVDFGDLMILGMALPNILGLLILRTEIAEKTADYWRRYQSGEMRPHKRPPG